MSIGPAAAAEEVSTMTTQALSLPLLEFLAYKAGCGYLSDLPRADCWQRLQLVRALEQIPPQAAALREWNDALDYLAHAPPEGSGEKARARLMAALSPRSAPQAGRSPAAQPR